MFAPSAYIAWVRQFYGTVPYDLATSGIPVVTFPELGLPLPSIDDVATYAALRTAIATYNDVPLADVTPALGTSHGVFLAYAAVLSPGDEILVEHPAYEPLLRAAEGLGATMRRFERRAEDGFRGDPDRVAAAMGARTRAIVVSSLHNPTGVRVDDGTLRAVAAVAEARGAYVIVDEVYAPFDRLPEDGVFRGSARKLANNIIAVSSLTKCFGLGMYRIGWVLGPEEIVRAAEDAATATIGHLPLGHAAYGARVFDAIGPLSTRAMALLAGKRHLAERWVASLPNAHWSAPEDGLFGLVSLPGRGDLRARIEARAREAGVLVGPGSFFGVPESFRLSWATCTPDRFEEGLRLLTPLAS